MWKLNTSSFGSLWTLKSPFMEDALHGAVLAQHLGGEAA